MFLSKATYIEYICHKLSFKSFPISSSHVTRMIFEGKLISR